MARTTVAAVRALVRPPYWTENFQQFVDIAHAVVNASCLTFSYSETILELLERYLAAHLYSSNDPGGSVLKARQVDTAREEYAVAASASRSPFEDLLKFFDPFGCLSRTDPTDGGTPQQTVIGINWLGKPVGSV